MPNDVHFDMSTWFLDYETYSECDIQKLGAHAYALHPSTRIILAAIAKDDGPVLLWDHTNPDGSIPAAELLEEMSDDNGPVVAHNAQFEHAISQACFAKTFSLPPPDVGRWQCTAAMCRRAAIPWNLFDASRFLQTKDTKHATGKDLIKWFCCPVESYPRTFDRAASWAAFRQYCLVDVSSEREIYHRLRKSFKLPKDEFAYDMMLNWRGIPVNRDALGKAQSLVTRCEEVIVEEFRALTGLNPTQRDAVMRWLQARGYPGENLQDATMSSVLEDPPESMTPEAVRALELRAGSAFTAIKKIPVMLAASEHDGRVRGGFLWSGALRTHRWAGRIIQPQNFKRPSIADTHIAYEMIKQGQDPEAFEMLWGAGMLEIIASCVRHFIEVPGRMLLDADFSNIEARITPWLCGQDDMLDEFRLHDQKKRELGEKGAQEYDVYVKMASVIFSESASKVSKDQRFVGKQATLACQFQVGWQKFKKMCAQYGRDLDNDVCKLAVEKYREKRDKIVEAWSLFNNAAKDAIRNKGHVIPAGRVQFVCGKLDSAGFHVLQMKLPSGHVLTYPLAKLERVVKKFENGAAEVEEIQFWGPVPGKRLWNWQSTYGGKLLENCITGDTEVLTQRGWVRVDSITTEPVWDGFEFVPHRGLKKTEGLSTIDLDGLNITGDHLIFTNTGGWVPAANVDVNEAYRSCPRPPMVVNQGGGETRPNVCTTEHTQPVYDLKDCGPHHQFVVRGKNKRPLIIHNCTQAVGGDFMTHGLLEAERRGYQCFATIHDQALCIAEDGLTPEGLREAMCVLPPWAENFPLEATASLTPFYTKD